jgi:sugar phosphate isomerase/epimerase
MAEEMANRSITVVSHAASFDVNPTAYSPAAQALALEETKKSLEFAKIIGSSRVTLHGGFNSFGGRFSRFDLMLLEKFIEEVLAYLDDNRLGIEICVENEAATVNASRPLESVIAIEDILSKFDQVRMTLDLAHVLKSSQMAGMLQIRDKRLDADAISPFLDLHADRVAILHISEPDKYRTHGRIDQADGGTFVPLFMDVATRLAGRDIPCILEYETAGFQSLENATDAIDSDISFLRDLIQSGT